MRIVIVEDDQDNLRNLETLCQMALGDSCKILLINPSGQSKEEILFKIQEFDPGLILLDEQFGEKALQNGDGTDLSGADIYEALGELQCKVVSVSSAEVTWLPQNRCFLCKQYCLTDDFYQGKFLGIIAE